MHFFFGDVVDWDLGARIASASIRMMPKTIVATSGASPAGGGRSTDVR
jgi:hypothetical protein